MVALQKSALTKLATVTGLSLNITTKQTLYTVPVSENAVISHVVVRNASGAAPTADAGFGGDASATDFRSGVQFDSLAAAGDGLVVTYENPDDPNPTPGKVKTYAAAAIFGMKVGTTVAATVDVDVFGYLT